MNPVPERQQLTLQDSWASGTSLTWKIPMFLVALLLAGCSAVPCSGGTATPGDETARSLPADVETTRLAVVQAARVCDFNALAELAGAGSVPFSTSGDVGIDLAEYWQAQEEAGEEPMRILIELLRMSAAQVGLENEEYRWPAAAGFEDWAAVPPEIRSSLSVLYDADALAQFDQIGGYTGYRTAINFDGEWLFYLEGA